MTMQAQWPVRHQQCVNLVWLLHCLLLPANTFREICAVGADLSMLCHADQILCKACLSQGLHSLHHKQCNVCKVHKLVDLACGDCQLVQSVAVASA